MSTAFFPSVYEMRGRFLNIFSFREYDGYAFNDDGDYTEERPPLRICCPSLDAYYAYDTRHVVHWKGDKLNGNSTSYRPR